MHTEGHKTGDVRVWIPPDPNNRNPRILYVGAKVIFWGFSLEERQSWFMDASDRSEMMEAKTTYEYHSG